MGESKLENTVSLVNAAKSGDKEAQDRLIKRFTPYARKIVQKHLQGSTGGVEDVDDLLQNILLKMYKNLPRFEYREPKSFQKWFSRCVFHEVVDHVRGLKRSRLHQTASLSDKDSQLIVSLLDGRVARPASEYARFKEMRGKLAEAMNSLSEEDRQVVLWRKEGKSFKDISGLLGLSQVAVRTRLSRALKRLREIVLQ